MEKGDSERDSFWWEILNTFNPLYYKKIAHRPLTRSFRNMTLSLILSFVILLILLIPFFATLPTLLNKELTKISEFNVDGNVTMTAPIEIPKRNSKVVIDTTGTVTKLDKEKVLVTKDYIYFKHFTKTKRIEIKKLLDIKSYQREFVWMVIGGLAIIIPSLLFYGLVIYLLKYLIIMFLFGIFFYMIQRWVLLFKVEFKTIMNILMFTIFPMALIEIGFLAFNTDYLIPVFSVYGVQFYLVSTLIYGVLGVFGVVLVEKKKKKDE